jgi:hypothetical protein
MRRFRRTAALTALLTATASSVASGAPVWTVAGTTAVRLLAGPAATWPAMTVTSHAPNWETPGGKVLCGVATFVETRPDPGTQAPLEVPGRGLQCSALGIPRPKHGIGDPVVKLGRGHAGRAQLVDQSQDELIFNVPPATLAAGGTWRREGIVCAVHAASVRCTNRAGHGFKISPGHVHLF